MIMILENARLSEKCANHCLRVTRINVLRRNDIEDSGIHSVSRHKNIDCIRPYCMTMVTMIATWRSIFQSIVHSLIIACHRLQACTSYAILACHKWMPPAVPKHPLFTGSLDMRQWALVTMTGGGLSVPAMLVRQLATWRWLWLWAAKVNIKCLKASLLGQYLRLVVPQCLTSMESPIFLSERFAECVILICLSAVSIRILWYWTYADPFFHLL